MSLPLPRASGDRSLPDEPEYPSGPWKGYYLYAAAGARHRQAMALTFREGGLTGAGMDDVGRFVVKGRYDRETREVWWTKTYLGRHSVFYKGYRENRGIWGTWEIRLGFRGGFHIWPAGLGEEAAAYTEAGQQVPVDAVSTGSAGLVGVPCHDAPGGREG